MLNLCCGFLSVKWEEAGGEGERRGPSQQSK